MPKKVNYSARGKRTERAFSQLLQDAAGAVTDAVCRNLVTSTGRVGHITALGFDFLVGNHEDGTALLGESKDRKTVLGVDAKKALMQVYAKAVEWNREPVFCFRLPDDMTRVEIHGKEKAMERDWCAVRADYLAELLEFRRTHTLTISEWDGAKITNLVTIENG